MNRLLFEKTYPYIFGLIASTLWVESKLPFPSEESDILSATLSVSSIFVGFLTTSKSILMGMNSQILNDLRRSGYIRELVSYIGQAIWLNLVFCAINIAGYFGIQTHEWFSTCWIFLAISSLMAFVRVTDIMLKVFEHN